MLVSAQQHALDAIAGEIPNLMQTVLWFWPTLWSGLYGRFLLGQLGGSGSIVMLNVFLSLFSITSRLATRPGAGTILRVSRTGNSESCTSIS